MPKYLDKDGLEEFFDDIKDLVHGPSYSQVSSWMDAHPDVLSSAIATDIADATDNWLDEHPEATTSVLDGSISFDKLTDAVYKGYVRSFETVADMKAATDLKAGMTCHTNGFHSAGDGGAAWYKVTSTGTANEMDVIALQDGLIATLVIIENHVTPEMFGAYGDGTHNDAQSVKRAISVTLSVDAVNTYLISDVITISNNFKLDGCTTGKFILNKDVSGEYTMSIHDCSFVINRMNFEIPEWSLLKYDASGSANDIRIYDVNDSRFSNCTFNAMNTKFNGIIDFIRDWNNVVIDNCQFKADATFDGSRHAGGVWIRNANVEQTHDECHNIVISNCSFDINSNDEPLAIWASKTDKPIKNVSLINTYIKGYEDWCLTVGNVYYLNAVGCVFNGTNLDIAPIHLAIGDNVAYNSSFYGCVIISSERDSPTYRMSVFTKSDYNPDDALFDSCIFTGIGFGANRVRLNNCIVKATGKIDSCYGLKAYNTYFNLTASGTAGFHDSIELYNCKLDLYGAGSIWQAYTDNTSVCICDGCIINSHIDNGYYVFVTNVGKWIVKNCIMTADNISTIRTTFGSDDILAFNILPNGYSHSGNEIGWSTNLVLPA